MLLFAQLAFYLADFGLAPKKKTQPSFEDWVLLAQAPLSETLCDFS
jgi:hypothetical protein